MHTLVCFCESRRRFSLFSPLNITYSFFCLLLPAVCSVAAVCRLVCPLPPPRPRGLFRPAFCVFIPSGAPLKLPGGLPSCLLCLVVLWWLPLLVRHQAQNAMTVGADAARIYPRPCLPLPMCCRVFRRLFRGFRVCVLLPCVVWWQ